MSKIAVIGIGNPFRGDDGAGWAVIDALEGKLTQKIKTDKIRGDVAELLDYFNQYSTVYLIDACKGKDPPGFWKRLDGLKDHLPLEETQTSTHGLSIREAIELGSVLQQLPLKLIIYAIYGSEYQMSHGLSTPVAGAIQTVAQNLMNEEDIQSCMKKV